MSRSLDPVAIYLLLIAIALLVPLSASVDIAPEISDKSRIALLMIALGLSLGLLIRGSMEVESMMKFPVELGYILYYGLMCYGIAVVAEFFILLTLQGMMVTTLPLSQVVLEKDFSLAVTFLIGYSIAEEVFFAFGIFGSFYALTKNPYSAHLASLTIFALSHIFVYGYNPAILLALATGRVIFNEFYRRYKKLGIPMIAHLTVNIFALLGMV